MNAIVLAPVFVQIALTFALLMWMGAARYAAASRGEVALKQVALGQPNWPPRVMKIDRAYHNQLELPLVFYALVALVLALGVATPVFVWLEWLFVGLRLVHAYVHVTTNHVVTRFTVFVVGVLALMAMWIWFAARVFGSI